MINKSADCYKNIEHFSIHSSLSKNIDVQKYKKIEKSINLNEESLIHIDLFLINDAKIDHKVGISKDFTPPIQLPIILIFSTSALLTNYSFAIILAGFICITR